VVECSTFADEFVHFAVEFVTLALSFGALAIKLDTFAIECICTRICHSKNNTWNKHKTKFSSCYMILFGWLEKADMLGHGHRPFYNIFLPIAVYTAVFASKPGY